MSKGNLFIISGPSGCGKSTVLHEIFSRRDNLFFSISATTRQPRDGEKDGVDYYFISREKFDEMLAKDEFLEHAEYVGNCYGTPIGPILAHTEKGNDVILDIEVQGAAQIKEKMPEAISVFIAPPSMEELEERLRGRSTETEDKIAGRLETARKELELAKGYDYIVVNDKVEDAAAKIMGIMESSKKDNN